MPVTRKFQVLAKVETSEGVDSSPGASDAILAYDPQASSETALLDRVPTGPSLSRDLRPVGRRSGELQFKSDLRGSGDTSAPIDEPDWGKLVKTSGMKAVTPKALTMPSPTGTGFQLGEELTQSAGAIRGVVVGLLSAGVPVHRLTGAGTVIVVPVTGTLTAAASTGASSGTTATASAIADYAGVAYKPTSRKLQNMVTAAACAAAVGEVVSIERAGVRVGGAQIIVNNGGFTNVDFTLLDGDVANGDTVRAAAGGTTTITTGPTMTETPSLTVQYNEDGEQRKILGARCDWTLAGSVYEPMQFEWSLRGDPGTAVDAVPVATSGLSTIAAPRLVGAICAYGRGAEIVKVATKELRVARGVTVEPNLDANRANGSTGSNVTDAQPELQVTVDRTHSAFAWETFQNNSTAIRFAAILGTTPGNIMGVIAPRCQITGLTRGDANGIATWQVTLAPIRLLEAGDDELYLVQL